MAPEITFNVEDKVFAKMKYYPAWPAKIISIKDTNKYRPKYCVEFYGTHARTNCLKAQLFPYKKHKFEFENPKKFSKSNAEMLAKAFVEVENELLLSTNDTDVFNISNNMSQTLNSGINKKVTELSVSPAKKLNTQKKSKRVFKRKKVNTSGVTFNLKNLLEYQPVVKIELMPNHVVDMYQKKYKEKFNVLSTNNESLNANEPVVKPSRSVHSTVNGVIDNQLETYYVKNDTYSKSKSSSQGPVLLTKYINSIKSNEFERSKVHDPSMEKKRMHPENNEKITTHLKTKTKTKSRPRKTIQDSNIITESYECTNNNNDEEQYGFYQENGVKISPGGTSREKNKNSRNITETINNNNEAKQKEILQRRDQIESPVSSQGFVADFGSTEWYELKKSFIQVLQNLMIVMDLIHNLRSGLRITNPDFKKTIDSLRELQKYKLPALLWIKYPEMVYTILKVSRYVGDIDSLDVFELDLFNNAAQIRELANAILTEIGLLFNVEEDVVTFERIFKKVVAEFNEKFKCLDQYVIQDDLIEYLIIKYLFT